MELADLIVQLQASLESVEPQQIPGPIEPGKLGEIVEPFGGK